MGFYWPDTKNTFFSAIKDNFADIGISFYLKFFIFFDIHKFAALKRLKEIVSVEKQSLANIWLTKWLVIVNVMDFWCGWYTVKRPFNAPLATEIQQ